MDCEARGNGSDARGTPCVLPAEPRALQKPGARRVQRLIAQNDGGQGPSPRAGRGAQGSTNQAEVETAESANAATVTPAVLQRRTHRSCELAASGVSPCTQIVSTFTESVEPSRATTLSVADHPHGALGGARRHRTGPHPQTARASAIHRAHTSDRRILRPRPVSRASRQPTATPIRPGRRAQSVIKRRDGVARSPRRCRLARTLMLYSAPCGFT